jgi:hypothetical protein
MSLLLLCLGTILAPSCPVSCQSRCSPPTSSGSVGAAFHPFSRSTTSPTRFCAAAPVPSPSESGRGTRWLLSAALRLARPRTPRLAACVTVADRWVHAQAVLPQPSGSRSQTRWSLHLLLLWRCHVTVPEQFSYLARRFCTPGTGGAFIASTDAIPVSSMGTAPEVGHLTSSPPSRGQSSGEPYGELATSLLTVKPVGVYSTTLVQYLYISCYLSDNKTVLSYLFLCLLPQLCLSSNPTDAYCGESGCPSHSHTLENRGLFLARASTRPPHYSLRVPQLKKSVPC